MRQWLSPNTLADQLGCEVRTLEELAETAGGQYRSFDISQQNKNKWRHLDDPMPPLKKMQHGILKRLLNNIPLPPFVFGGVRGRSVRDAASVHVGSPCIVALDIANCFGSVT